jgi:glycosidase
MKVNSSRRTCSTISLLFSLAAAALAQQPVIKKVDPPNWWANMPKAMLLVEGEDLAGAQFRLSDSHLRIDRTKISANGHWAELWLAASPAKAETVTISASNQSGKTTAPFRFDERKKPAEGFAGFSSKDVMYLIMTDRFADGNTSNDEGATERSLPRGWHGGDLQGVTEHLDYLQRLGITTVWITPVYQNHEAKSYHGYGATDMYAVDEHYGSLDDLKALSAALHQRGMKLVLDTVPNHVGPAHPWAEDEPEPDWFHGTKASHTKAQTEFKPLTDPHAPWRDQRNVTEGWFANTLPDMNQENPAVAQYLTQNAVWWVEQAGLDGLRIDTFPYVGREFWQGFHAELHGLYPHLTTVGEVYNPDATITSSFAAGVTRNGVDTGLDTPFDFPTYFALREVFVKNAPMSRLTDVWRLDALYPHPEKLVPFLGNHDTVRFLGEKGATQDQLRLAFTVLLTMRGMPQIYSGDEIAMAGGEDPDNRHDFPGGFPGDTQSAFTAPTPEQANMEDWVRALLKLRKEHAALQEGQQQSLKAEGDVLAYVRHNANERLLIAVNRGDTPTTVTLPMNDTVLSGSTHADALLGKGTIQLTNDVAIVSLPGHSVLAATLR